MPTGTVIEAIFGDLQFPQRFAAGLNDLTDETSELVTDYADVRRTVNEDGQHIMRSIALDMVRRRDEFIACNEGVRRNALQRYKTSTDPGVNKEIVADDRMTALRINGFDIVRLLIQAI